VSRLSRQCGILSISQPYRPPRSVTRLAFKFISLLFPVFCSQLLFSFSFTLNNFSYLPLFHSLTPCIPYSASSLAFCFTFASTIAVAAECCSGPSPFPSNGTPIERCNYPSVTGIWLCLTVTVDGLLKLCLYGFSVETLWTKVYIIIIIHFAVHNCGCCPNRDGCACRMFLGCVVCGTQVSAYDMLMINHPKSSGCCLPCRGMYIYFTGNPKISSRAPLQGSSRSIDHVRASLKGRRGVRAVGTTGVTQGDKCTIVCVCVCASPGLWNIKLSIIEIALEKLVVFQLLNTFFINFGKRIFLRFAYEQRSL
jgi:hypothetical protein